MHLKFIAGDWGTSNLRLFLCEMDPQQQKIDVLDQLRGPGIASIEDAETTLFQLIAPWTKSAANMPIVLSGMVGSNIGWHETSYQACPLDLNDFFTKLYLFKARGHSISIVPGLSCTNLLGQPDLIRGEETQVIGWAASQTASTTHDFLLCLPGTHTKWLNLSKGVIRNFITGFTGELFTLLCDHSILLKNAPAACSNKTTFLNGLKDLQSAEDLHLIHRLFSVRSKQMAKTISPETATAYLSALLIGSDTLGALDIYAEKIQQGAKIIIIGETELSSLYQSALEFFGHSSSMMTGSQACLSAYSVIAKNMYVQSLDSGA